MILNRQSIAPVSGERRGGASTPFCQWAQERFCHRLRGFVLLALAPIRIAIIVEFGPLEECTAVFAWYVAGVAHPKVSPPVFLLFLNDPQHRRDAAFTLGCVFWVQMGLVVTICDVDASVAGHGMRVDGLGRGDAVLPFLLHFCMHHEQRVVG